MYKTVIGPVDHGSFMTSRNPPTISGVILEIPRLSHSLSILRDLVNATVGFEALAEEIHKPAKSLHRMRSKSGNPTMSNISAVLSAITRALKVEASGS